ncbi:cyclic lactone autoinducer peptide AgrD [Staphylococcus sp. 17KM0847]|nr:cyclic lactone autoinducer peptide [Staphylococcus sp. 17KM0847]QLK86455.1 cyclic lactone autoinducer peptide [Staphylococcus sp. 17KM0847]
MNILDAIVTFFTNLFKAIGNFGWYRTCTGYFDEPEIPRELLDLDQ